MNRYKKFVYAGLPVLGALFYLLYLRRSAIDMVYSDYIRLINSYLPDVWNPKKFFVPDLLTRIPVNYLERAVNVQFFGYSVTFDRVMGVLGFFLSAWVLGMYSRKMKISMGWYGILMTVMFSLNKWEMIYNGTGWAHFMAFACFYYHYFVLDRVYGKRKKRGDVCLLFVLPAAITIGVAGPYCAIYSVTVILAYLFLYLRNRRTARETEADAPSRLGRSRGKSAGKEARRAARRAAGKEAQKSAPGAGLLIGLLLSVAVPLLLYLWSDSGAVYEHAGAVDAPLLGTFLKEPKFFLTFFLKSFSSMIFGVELIGRHMKSVPDWVWCVAGFFVLASYVLALWMNFYYRITEKTIFPLMFLASGGLNHLLILGSRWIFIPNDNYGMSSRYALQYQVGILGILLTFALVSRIGWKRGRKTDPDRKTPCGRGVVRGIAVIVTGTFLIGNLVTTAEEFSFGINRKLHNMEIKEAMLHFDSMTDEEMQKALEFKKDGTREALMILKEHGWNIFNKINEDSPASAGGGRNRQK